MAHHVKGEGLSRPTCACGRPLVCMSCDQAAGLTWSEVWPLFAESHLPGLKTRSENERSWANVWEPYLGSKPISSTTAEDIYDIFDLRRLDTTRRGGPPKENTLRNEGRHLVVIANWAEREGLIDPHRLRYVDWPAGAGHSATLSDAQFRIVLRAVANDDRLAAFTLLHHDCFLTRSEAVDLQLEHVDFERGEVLVTGAKSRVVPILPTRTAAVIARLRDENPSGRVFTICPRHIDRLLAEGCERFGLKAVNGEPLSFRMVTRTARERLRRLGTPEEVIAWLTGRVGPFTRMPVEVQGADVRYWARRYEATLCLESGGGA